MSRNREPIWDREAEVCVLGGCLMDGEAIAKVVDVVSEDSFYAPAHKRLFAAMLQLFERGEVIDPVTLGAELRASNSLDGVGGLEYLSELLFAVPSASNIVSHAEIVRDHWRLRRLQDAAGKILANVQNREGKNAAEIIEVAEQMVFEVAAEQRAGGLEGVRTLLWPTMADIEKRQVASDGVTGVPSGYRALDEMTGGFQKGDLVILAARPSMGKTSAAIGMALHAAIEKKVPVAFFSLEMTKSQIVTRMLCYEAMVDVSKMYRGGLTDVDYVRLADASALVSSAPLWVDDTGGLSPMDIRAKLRRLVAERPDLGAVFVDYIGRMRGQGENRTREIGYISGGLKDIAKEFNVPMIALCQLSRAPEQRADHRPILSDLRESGDIEQDADLVIFLYRPERYYGPVHEGKDIRGQAEFIIAKQRNGPIGTVDMYFRSECARYEDLAPEWRMAS